MAGRVTAHLATNPVLPPHRWPLCLDGIVAWRVLRHQLGDRFGVGELTVEDCAATDRLDLPLDRLDRGDDWVWAASSAVPVDDHGTAVQWVHSRNDLGLYERRVPVDRQTRVDEARAEWKPRRLPMVVTVCTAVEWTVESPDPDRLMAILDTVTAVGKGWARGSGQVTSWTWDDIDDIDWDASMRPIPAASSPLIAPIRPPYHHPAQRRPVEVAA
jgi:CRISPR type IV-associated protein Csf3